MARPINGAITMNTAITLRPLQMRELKPAAATAAPAIPPMSACELDVGRPSQKVNRLQAIAPINPAKITETVRTSWLTTSLAMVEATLVPNTRNAMKLNAAAHIRA